MDEAFDAGALRQIRELTPAPDDARDRNAACRAREDADEIHHRIGAGNDRGQRARIAEIGAERRDLADIAHRPQKAGAASHGGRMRR